MCSSRRTVLVVELGSEHGLALLVARSLAEWHGTRIHILTADAASAARYSRHVQSLCSWGSASSAGTAGGILSQEAKRVRADVVLPVDQQAVRVLTAHRHSLSAATRLVPMPSIASLDHADDKHAVALLLQELQLSLPRTIPVTRDSGFAGTLGTLSFPVLLKPTRRAGGRGIREFATAAALVEYAMHGTLGDEPHIVQEFVRGYDLSCNVLCEDGRIVAHTLQRGFLPPAKPFQMPSGVEFFYHDDTMASIRKLVAALKWNGVANIDMRFDEAEGRARILEINPRFWASLLGSVSVGVNFAELACRIALDLECPAVDYRLGRFIVQKRVALRHLFGVLRRDRNRSTSPLRSVLSYLAVDPFPEIALLVRQLRRSLLH